jgi:cytochrome bd-type quinol oxidase subunit 2
MDLKTTIPPRIWPGLAILGLLLVALACEFLGRDAEELGHDIQQIAAWLAVPVVPFTMVAVWMNLRRAHRFANSRGLLTARSICIRLGLSFAFALLTLHLYRARMCTLSKFEVASVRSFFASRSGFTETIAPCNLQRSMRMKL